MNSKQFIRTISALFSDWLNNINQSISNGVLQISGEYSFTHMLRVAESSTHFICELCGSKKYEPNQAISIKRLKKPEKIIGNTTSYFWSSATDENQENAIMKICAERNTITGMCLLKSTKTDFDLLSQKLNLPILKVIILPEFDELKIPISIAPETDYLLLQDVELLEINGICVYYRVIPCALILKKPVKEDLLRDYFKDMAKQCFQTLNFTNRMLGLNTTFLSSIEDFANQLFGLSTQNIDEPIIDHFIEQHADYFAKALGYKKALSQKSLKWIEKDTGDPDESIPDYLMEREDGYYDILDLKKGEMKFRSITKYKRSGKRGKSRTRFIDYASELLAQLKDYERYFTFKNNREYAYDTYGVKTKEIRLIGIIGNYNNFIREEVDRSLDKENIMVFSYNEIVTLLKRIGSSNSI